MSVLYDSAIYENGPVNSYWEATASPINIELSTLNEDQSFEVAIIGGGYTGLSAALHLARDHGVGACVLEAGHMGWGASGRNGGLVGLAATKLSVKALISHFGVEETRRFFSSQLDGLQLVRNLCEEENIDCDLVGDGYLEVAHKPSRLEGLRQYANTLTREFGIATESYSAEEFADTGYQSTEQYGGVRIGAGFGLHPLKFSLGLATAAHQRGAVLYPYSEVTSWSRQGSHHVLATAGGQVRAKRVVMATNGFTREGVHAHFDRRLLPVMSNIITTRPMTQSELDAHQWVTRNPVVNTRTLLFYFRMLPDNSFLFGARGDASGSRDAALEMKSWITRRLREVFPYWQAVEISHSWRGLVCMTRKRTPSIGRLSDDPTVYYGFGYHGNGINTAPWAGKQIADMIAANDDGESRIPVACRGMPPAFPLPGLRLWYLRAARHCYKLSDDLF